MLVHFKTKGSAVYFQSGFAFCFLFFLTVGAGMSCLCCTTNKQRNMCPMFFPVQNKYVIRFAQCLAFSVSQACSKDEGNCLRARLEVYFVLLEYIFFDIRNMGSQNANIIYSNQVSFSLMFNTGQKSPLCLLF